MTLILKPSCARLLVGVEGHGLGDRGRDERVRDSGGDDGEVGGAHAPDVAEGGHDSPDGAEKAHERGDACGCGEEAQPALEARDLHGGGSGERARERLQRADRGPHRRLPAPRTTHLLVDLDVARLEDADERARSELRAHRVHLGELAALAEHVDERRRVRPRAVEHETLVQDDRPGNQREQEENDKDGPGDRAALGDETRHPAGERRGLGLGEQGGEEHINLTKLYWLFRMPQ